MTEWEKPKGSGIRASPAGGDFIVMLVDGPLAVWGNGTPKPDAEVQLDAPAAGQPRSCCRRPVARAARRPIAARTAACDPTTRTLVFARVTAV